MSLTVKAFFKDEIRRFGIDVSNATSFDYLEGKVRGSFQNLPPKGKLLMKWKDVEGDLITFSTDEELVEALSSADNGVFKVYLEKKENQKAGDNAVGDIWVGLQGLGHPPPPPPPGPHGPPPPSPHHPQFGFPPFGGPHAWPMFEETDGSRTVHLYITCDGCGQSPIQGVRHKCETCDDFDLCSTCKDKGVHSEHQLKEITEPTGCPAGPPPPHFWRPGPWGRRFGRGKGRFHGCRKWDTDNSSGDEQQRGIWKIPLSKEERQKIGSVVNTIKQAAKTQAFEVAGAVAGDCAGDAVVIAVRSSIRRALMVQNRSGLGPKPTKKKCKKNHEESTSSSDESDSDVQEVVLTGEESKKGMKKGIKMAAKNVRRLAFKEVSENFGKLAGKWAALAVQQTMVATMKQCMKAEKKIAKKEEKKSVNFAEQPMEQQTLELNSEDSSAPLSIAVNNVPIYPPIKDTVSGVQWAAPAVSKEEKAIIEAITAFQNMGFSPDEKLIDEIKKAKGDITKVFDNMKK